MQNIKKISNLLIVTISLMAILPAFGMNDDQHQPQNHDVPEVQGQQQNQPVICSICGQNDPTVQTFTNINTNVTYQSVWDTGPQVNYRYNPHNPGNPRLHVSYGNYRSVPIYNQHQCPHVICANCVQKCNGSSVHTTRQNACKICLYQHAAGQHNQCNMCNHGVQRAWIAETHDHGLCNQHHNNAQLFQYSPIDAIKDWFVGNGCTVCFIRNNPGATTCETRLRYWGEIALISAAIGTVAYCTMKIYNWWQKRNEQKEQEKWQEANQATEVNKCTTNECQDTEQDKTKTTKTRTNKCRVRTS